MAIVLLHVVNKDIVKAMTQGSASHQGFDLDPEKVSWEGVHSVKAGIIMGFILSTDSIENCKKVGSSLFQFLEDLHIMSLSNEYYESGLFFTFRVSWPADMKAQQQILERGGGSYSTHWFCLCCDVTNHTKGQQSPFRCEFCKR